jgi:hypothetical protein
VREDSKDAFVGAIQVDMGVLLGLASRAGVQLEDVVDMTRAQLTTGLSPAGTVPTADSAQGVAISQLPPTTAMGAQARGTEAIQARWPAGDEEEVSWAMIWEAEMQAAHGFARRGEPGEYKQAGSRGGRKADRAASSARQRGDTAHETDSEVLGDGAQSLSHSRGTQGRGAWANRVGSGEVQRAKPTDSPARVSWARVVASEGTARSEAQGLALSLPVKKGQGAKQAVQGAGDTGGKRLTTEPTPDIDVAVTPPGAQNTEQVRDRQPKRGRGNGTGRTVEVVGVGELSIDLPDEVLFEVLARVPTTELHRLLRQTVSRRFAGAIRNVFLEMASQAVRRACDLDEQGAVGNGPYEQAFKIRYIVPTFKLRSRAR